MPTKGKKEEEKNSKTLAEWIINKVNTKEWRMGNISGCKHYGASQMREWLDIFGRENLISQVQELADNNLIEVSGWTIGKNGWKEVIFPVENMSALIEREGLIDPRQELENKKQFILKYRDCVSEPWLLAYYDEQLKQIEKGNIPEDAKDEKLYHCLNEIVMLQQPSWMRMFSSRVLGKSKKFQKDYCKRIVTRLRKSPRIDEDMEDYEVLAEFGIMTYSQTLQWKGPVVFELETGKRIDLSFLTYGAILNSQTLLHAKIVSLQTIKKIVVIENQANYENQIYDENTLYIFCHGFLSPLERNFLKRILELADETVRYYHWSDLDYGGIRIYNFVKKMLFPSLLPMHMDQETYEQCVANGYGIKLDSDKRKKLEKLEAGDLQQLKKCILEYNMEIEQENIT